MGLILRCIILIIGSAFVFDIFPQTNNRRSDRDLLPEKQNISSEQNTLLSNGILHKNPYAGMIGNPYYKDEILDHGAIKVQGDWINDLSLWIDLVNQDLILNLENTQGGMCQVVVRKELVEQVKVDGKIFIYCNELDAYVEQIARHEDLFLIRTHSKILRISQSETKMEIRSSKAKLFVKTNSKIIRLRHRRDFKKLVLPENYTRINEQFRRSGFRINFPNEKSGKALLNNIAKLI